MAPIPNLGPHAGRQRREDGPPAAGGGGGGGEVMGVKGYSSNIAPLIR